MSTTFKAVAMAKLLLTEKIQTAASLLDATAGNGFDTLFLAQTSAPTAKIWAFDVQKEAIAAARQLLQEAGLTTKVEFILDCHSHLKQYLPDAVDIAMFNLGYLPKADHNIKTSAATTVAAIQDTCALLAKGGLISIIAYPGHPGGQEEYDAVKDFLTNLPSANFSVGCWQMLNQKNCPPVLFLVAKK
jgi:tRNA1(Val) A37 N6-methylase TrmN6